MKAILREQAINVALFLTMYLWIGQTALYMALGWYGAIAAYSLLVGFAWVCRRLSEEVAQTGADMVDLFEGRY